MSSAWTAVAIVGVGTIALKSTGPVLLGGRELPARLMGLLSVLAPALLAALVVTQAFASGRHLVLDPRAFEGKRNARYPAAMPPSKLSMS